MSTLHLLHQGARLRLRSGRLVLTDTEDRALLSVPARKIRRVVVHGNIGFTTPAFVFLLQNGATITFVSLHGRLYGLAGNLPLPSPERIAKQLSFVRTHDALLLAKAIVRAKLQSQMEYLRRKGLRAHDLKQGEWLLQRLERARDVNQLRGIEGMGSRFYFQALARLHPTLGFEGRRRRPPRDPVNAALSYAYTLLLGVATSAVTHAGLHPEVGILHVTGRRRPSLALDLMEEFRVPVVDIPVFAAFSRGDLDRRDAQVVGRGIYIGHENKRKLINLIERRLRSRVRGRVSYQELIFQQAERLAAAVIYGKKYQAFSLIRRSP